MKKKALLKERALGYKGTIDFVDRRIHRDTNLILDFFCSGLTVVMGDNPFFKHLS